MSSASPPRGGTVRGAPLVLLRLEGLALLVAAVLAYRWSGEAWWLFGLGFFVPDLSMLAYLAGPRPGAVLYNAAHTTLAPMLLGGFGVLTSTALALALAAIWAAHIGFDRMLGYGLKYGDGFGHTHLDLLGRGARSAGVGGERP